MAAITAAAAGARTVLLDPGRHVGGMISGGLGRTDMERQESLIGGMALEFFSRIATASGAANGSDASVNAQIFAGR